MYISMKLVIYGIVKVSESELLQMEYSREIYNPVVEDISLDDDFLRDAVEHIESE